MAVVSAPVPLRLAFWNCGVAPTRGTGKRSAAEAARVVDALLRRGADAVALCEVDEPTARQIHAELGRNVCLTSMTEPLGRSRWDLALFSRADRLRPRVPKPVVGRDEGPSIRAAQHLRLTPKPGDIFDLYLLHWRGRRHSNGHTYRSRASQTLWASVAAGLRQDRRIVVLGDFNDEPFDRPLTELRASRDPHHVLKRPRGRLYNPSWWLAAPDPTDPWTRFGTYAYAQGETSGHYLLDQALTSAHYLDAATPALPRAHVVSFGSLGITAPTIMDHLPLELVLP